MARKYRNLTERLLANVVDEHHGHKDAAGNASACWVWIGARSYHGYGSLTLWDRAKGAPRKKWAHRVAYEELTGRKLAEGETVDHKCRVKCCINPAHLEAVSDEENNARRLDFWRRVYSEQQGQRTML
jgi:hypothetical protein